MKLICISNSNRNDRLRLNLTVGKVYDGEIDDWGSYIVRNDAGEINPYSKRTFITLDEWREEKLKEIGI